MLLDRDSQDSTAIMALSESTPGALVPTASTSSSSPNAGRDMHELHEYPARADRFGRHARCIHKSLLSDERSPARTRRQLSGLGSSLASSIFGRSSRGACHSPSVSGFRRFPIGYCRILSGRSMREAPGRASCRESRGKASIDRHAERARRDQDFRCERAVFSPRESAPTSSQMGCVRAARCARIERRRRRGAEHLTRRGAVSMCSVNDRSATPRSRSASAESRKCRRLRPIRSSFQTTRVSPAQDPRPLARVRVEIATSRRRHPRE
jgi:hypothetical protein